MTKRTKVKDISKNPARQLLNLAGGDLMPLPDLQDKLDAKPPIKPLSEEQNNTYECSLDGVSAVRLAKPQSTEEEKKLVASFIKGLKKLLSKEDNWTFLQPLTLSLEYCAKCQACSEECPVYVASGKQEIYRPSYRSEVLRRIIHRYVEKGSKAFVRFTGNDVELNWTTIARLAESSYRCTLCRRCSQSCIRGVDNGLIARELRKVFSQEMGIAAKELHESGTVQQLKVGASTGLRPKAFDGIIQFMEEEIEEKMGRKIRIPVDKKGVDFLLIHNTGEYMSWPENPEAFAILFDAAGINWTLSSELGGYEATNYGLWYDDFQFSRIAFSQAKVAKDLRVKKIVIGECGHAHKAAIVTADRVFPPELNIPRESCMPILEEIMRSGKLKLDPQKNNFPVTLHDPCNMVRSMGIVEPQRRILRVICPQFREMEPHGVENYCCGGGSGFAIMSSMNFPDWKLGVSGRMKVKQIIDAFEDVLDPRFGKYVCAPCSNCKGQLRDLISYYDLGGHYNITYGGLVELMVNAMVDTPERFVEVEEAPAVEVTSDR
ncbi:(Fe-S)-binding protein [Chloroflexota bacterium]